MEQRNVTALAERLQSFMCRFEEWEFSVEPLRIDPPANDQQLCEIEASLGIPLPDKVRQALTEVSAHISFRWSAGEVSLNLPEELDSVCWGGIDFGLESVASAERARQEWLEVYSDPSDSYDALFYDKFGVIEVDNGDVIAVDLCADSGGRVVYLSHDGDLTHGMVLGGLLQSSSTTSCGLAVLVLNLGCWLRSPTIGPLVLMPRLRLLSGGCM